MTYDEFKQNFLPEFLNINSYAGRMRYADAKLPRIGSGSGRRVYDIDGEKVLKLAMNAKGVAQNEVEESVGQDNYTASLVTQVFDYANDSTWLIAEKAKKVTKKRIEQVENIPNFERMAEFLVDFERSNKSARTRQKDNFSDEEKEFFWDGNEFSSSLLDFIGSYGQSAGDMTRPSSYGEVIRDGQPTIVLTDYGLSDDVADTHYSGKEKQRYQMYELYNYADGNDDILSDAGGGAGGQEIRTGMWAQMPYGVGDGDGVINENFIKFVSNRDNYPDKTVNGIPELTDAFHECVNNLKQTLSLVENKKQFYGNLLKLQEYLIRRGFFNREPLMSEEYQINEEAPDVKPDNLADRSYADEIAKEVANKLELDRPKYLGDGANGFAYKINNNLVMKLTTDISEADAASRLMRGRPKNIVEIYKLYKVYDTETDKSIFVIMEEYIDDIATDRIRNLQEIISKINPDGLSYEDIMTNIKKPVNFNHDAWVEWARNLLTANPESGVGRTERQKAYEYLVSMFNIRQELLDFRIKSTDYITIGNLGYKNNVLKYFDVGDYYGIGEPDIRDDNIIDLPEGVIEEDYPRERADAVALEMAQKLSVGEPKFMGAGFFGVAYDIGDNKVLKITKDNSEAYENIKLIGQPLKYIAEPYRVFEVKSNINADAQKTYAIILEKLKSDTPYFKRMYNRLDYAFKKIFKIDYKHVFEMYQYNDEEVGGVNKTQIDNYFKKNSEDAEFFFSILRIEEELQKYGIDSVDYYNPDNLGYKPSGVIGFFDVGFTDGFAQPHGAEQMSVNVAEDGSAKFSTDSAMGQDEFPPYNTNDTTPSINNDLDANIAMYEDLEYNHVDGDATQDEYMLSESRADFLSWKRKNVTIRGMQEVGQENNGMAFFGQGLYTAALGNKELARKYGKVYFVVGAIPNHPKIVNTWNDAEIFMQQVVVQYGKENGIDNYFNAKKDFDAKTNVKDEMLKLGYDGLIIKGREMVNYTPPEDVKYFGTEQELEHYYEAISNNINERDKSYGKGSRTVKVKKKCQLGGLGDGTSVACNQGDINNLEFGSVNEDNLEISEYFSSLVPDMNEDDINKNIGEARKMMKT